MFDDGAKVALGIYGRYLDLVEQRGDGSPLPVVTFSDWWNGCTTSCGSDVGSSVVGEQRALSQSVDAWAVVFYAPGESVQCLVDIAVLNGAGKGPVLAGYERCFWRVNGNGHFLPLAGANPIIGNVGEVSSVSEDRVEILCADRETALRVVAAVRGGGSYEVTVCYAYRVELSGASLSSLKEESTLLEQVEAKTEEKVEAGADIGRGPNYQRNRDSRARRKRALQEKRNAINNSDWRKDSVRQGFFSVCDDDTQVSLKTTRALRYIAENKRETEKAERDLLTLRASSVEDEVKKRNIQTRLATERAMVSIEKTHAALAATGNVPGNMTGFAATIVGSGSISPDSSASGHEFRQCQKALLDSQAEVKKYRAQLGLPESKEEEREMMHADGIFSDNTETREMLEDLSCFGEQSASEWGYPGKIKITPIRVNCGF